MPPRKTEEETPEVSIEIPIEHLRYMRDALYNAYNLSLTHDLQAQFSGLKPKVIESKLTKMIGSSYDRLVELIGEDDG